MDAAETILRFKLHRDPLVHKTVIALIPTLAHYDTQTFSEHFMHKAMAHLLEQLSKPAERSFGMNVFLFFWSNYSLTLYLAFIAIGHVATSVGSDMKSFLEPIMDHIKQGLQMRGYVQRS